VKHSPDKIGALIGLKRHEQPSEEYFEDFLREFQDRRRAELVERSSFALMLERVGLWLQDVGNVRWAYAAGAGYAMLLLGLFFWPHGAQTVNLPSAPVVNEHLVAPVQERQAVPADSGEDVSTDKALPVGDLPEQEF